MKVSPFLTPSHLHNTLFCFAGGWVWERTLFLWGIFPANSLDPLSTLLYALGGQPMTYPVSLKETNLPSNKIRFINPFDEGVHIINQRDGILIRFWERWSLDQIQMKASFPGDSVVKNRPANAGLTGFDPWIP